MGRGLSNKSMRGGDMFAARALGQMHRGLGALGSWCPLAEPALSGRDRHSAVAQPGARASPAGAAASCHESLRYPRHVLSRASGRIPIPNGLQSPTGSSPHTRPAAAGLPSSQGNATTNTPPVPLAEWFANIFLSSSSPFHK